MDQPTKPEPDQQRDPNLLFLMETSKSNILKMLFDCINHIIQEANITVTSEGMKLCKMKIVEGIYVYTNLGSANFESFYCARPFEMGINLNHFWRLIKNQANKGILRLEAYGINEEPEELIVSFLDETRSRCQKSVFKLLHIDPEEDGSPPLPEALFDTCDHTISISSGDFYSIIREFQTIEASHVRITSVGNSLYFKNPASALTWAETEICRTDGGEAGTELTESGVISTQDSDANLDDAPPPISVIYKNEHQQMFQGTYSIAKLMNCIKAKNLCNTMYILLKSEIPLILQYTIGDLGVLRFLIAESSDD